MGRKKQKTKRRNQRKSGTKTDYVSNHAKQGVILKWEAVGHSGISAEILKSIPWRAPQKIKKAFEMKYTGENKEDIETWLRNIIVLIPRKKVIDRLEVQTRGVCAQSVLAK